MSQVFSLTRDFRSVSWGATLKYNLLRAACAGITFAAGGIVIAIANPRSGITAGTSLTLGATLAIGYPIFYLPLGLLLAFLARFFSPFAFVAFCFGAMVAIGDPLVFVLRGIFPRLIPVARPAFISFRMLIFVLNDEVSTDYEREPTIEPSDVIENLVSPRREPFLARRQAASDSFDNTMSEFMRSTREDPERALAFVERLSPELRSKSSIAFGRFMALRTLALGSLIGTDKVSIASSEELLGFMDRNSLRCASMAVQQISEIERLHPKYIENLVDDDGVQFAEQAVDDVCMLVERLLPGKIQNLLGWTKLAYFGGDRLAVHKDVRKKDPSLKPMLRTRIAADEQFTSAVCMDYGNINSVASATFVVYRYGFAEVDDLVDAGIVGTFQISSRSRFRFSPWTE